MPFGRNAARVIGAVIHYPAALFAAILRLGAIVFIALGIRANMLTIAGRPQICSDGRTIPPSEYFSEKTHEVSG